MKRKHIIWISAVVVLLLVLVLAKKQGWIGSTEDGLAVTTEVVESRTIEEMVMASGRIQPEVEVTISPEVSGEIVELAVVEGQEVKKGDLLLRINPDIYLAAVSRAQAAMNSGQAQLAQARAQFVEAKKSFERNQELVKKGAISTQEFEAATRGYEVAKLAVEAAEFQVKSGQATLKEAQDNLRRTTIYAPADGKVNALKVEQGERVVGTAQMAGTELLRVSDLSKMEVVVDVNENDIIRVAMGDTAFIEVDAYLGKTFKGVVTEIANASKNLGTSADQITNFEVKVRILESSYQDLSNAASSPFRSGMTASVRIRTDRKLGVIAIPIQAVTTRTDTSTSAKSYKMRKTSGSGEEEEFEVVFLESNGKANLRVVKTGIQDDEFIEVLAGLDTGLVVITGPYNTVSTELKNGSAVKVTKKEDLFKKD